MKVLFILVIIFSCWSLSALSKVQEIPVTGQKHALEIMQSKLQFLRLTYEQFQDPVSMFTKFRQDCLKQIEIGEEREIPKGMISVSKLFYGKDYGTGLCPTQKGAREGLFVLLYCRERNVLYQISCFKGDCQDLKWDQRC